MPLTNEDIDELERLLHDTWPTAGSARCLALARKLRPYAWETIERAIESCYGEGERGFLPADDVVAVCRRIEPQAELRAGGVTPAQRTARDREAARSEGDAIAREWDALQRRLADVGDDELDALRPRILERLGDARLACHETKPIRTTPPLAAAAAALLDEDVVAA